MTQISAAQVKELRENTGAGMMDCKKALQENGGDLEAAVDWLRTKGLAAAQKKAGRVAAEGLVAVVADDTRAALVEVNAETDFVARNEQFQAFVLTVANLAKGADGDLEAVKSLPFPDSGRTAADELTHLIATIGENMSLRRAALIAVERGVVGSYVHGAVAPGLGRIGVLVGVESDGDAAQLGPFAKQVAMHIAASAPQAVAVDSLDPTAVERERNVLREQARDSGKPEEIIEKMVEGRLRKFYQDVVLGEQTWVHDPDLTVAKAVAAVEKDIGKPIRITAFERFALGEGIEKEEADFAAEVAAQAAR